MTTLDEWHERNVSLNRYPSPPDSTFAQAIQLRPKANRKSNISWEARGCCQDPPLLFIPFTCNCLRLFVPSDLGSVCNLGLLFFGPISHDFGGVIVVFGTASVLVELLFGFFIVFITLPFGFGVLLVLGGGSLDFLRRRSFVWREDAV